ncbi:MAG TPA: NAD(P)-dependent oxidoreductase, partial [Nevskiaceae bacterium]|nr:NAD(P)-dependent oxidoreductase [Nevskiaceae bacterium]
LLKHNGGMGLLFCGVPGVAPARVLVLGGGVVGLNAARMALGLGAEVVVLERSIPRMAYIDEVTQGRVITRYSSIGAVEEELVKADVIIGAVLVPGAEAPKLIKREHLKQMKPGSVLVDVAIDQGGCFETSKPTTHEDPTYVVDGVVHYCVANMPGGVPRTSTYALNNATLPFTLQLANLGWKKALAANPHLRAGLNVCEGKVTHREVAGRMSIQAGAHAMEKAQAGNGVLLGGVPGVPPAEVLVIGGGVVGYNAARIAVGMGANVTILDRSLPRLNQLDALFNGRLNTIYSTEDAVDQYTRQADLVIGAVLVPGAAAPKLVRREHLRRMKPGSVVVDVAIDQGGCFETSRATTHQKPTYVEEGIVHYCVANMPGGVARTSTFALTNATLPFALSLADKGYRQALIDDVHLREGLNVHRGRVTYQAVARDLGYDWQPALDALKS